MSSWCRKFWSLLDLRKRKKNPKIGMMSRESPLQKLFAIAAELQVVARSLADLLPEEAAEEEFPEWARLLVESQICLVCRQNIKVGQKSVRGLHQYCARKTWKVIHSGKMTEIQAVTAGLMAPESRPGPKETTTSMLDRYLEGLPVDEAARESVDTEAIRKAVAKKKASKNTLKSVKKAKEA